ncbi:leukocyte elastase inhibitor-like isoform X2 [Pomacea canaliculata]|uniref:leukocyte elastase inhibitor-like isoform X2 n=1 Tax=Pomacea canaliculata TaxID=400727 RepID=UPI000D72808D|nr:leukocyte elastase inhibitor-like isoform X2 [Pomacea canaliculata]
MASLRHLLVLLLSFGLLFDKLWAFARQTPTQQQQQQQQQRFCLDSQLSLSSSAFGTALYRRLAYGNHDNIIVSPLSVYTALTMIIPAAAGDTERELDTALVMLPQQDLQCEVERFLNSLTAPASSSMVVVRWGNGLFYNRLLQSRISQRFIQSINRYNGAQVDSFEWPEPERKINAWVNQLTEGEIPQLLQPGSIPQETILFLLNAVYFEASWETQFVVQSPISFTTVLGKVVTTPSMASRGLLPVLFLEELDVSLVELSYRGGRYSLYLLVPSTFDGLHRLEARLDSQVLDGILWRARGYRPVAVVRLPKFKLRTRKSLNEDLKTMGLTSMFDARKADFSRLVSDVDEGLSQELGKLTPFVNQVLHEAIIEVSENGTKAAAATSIGFVDRSLDTSEDQFRVDRPFVFIIRDKASGLNLFTGRVTDPTLE